MSKRAADHFVRNGGDAKRFETEKANPKRFLNAHSPQPTGHEGNSVNEKPQNKNCESVPLSHLSQ